MVNVWNCCLSNGCFATGDPKFQKLRIDMKIGNKKYALFSLCLFGWYLYTFRFKNGNRTESLFKFHLHNNTEPRTNIPYKNKNRRIPLSASKHNG